MQYLSNWFPPSTCAVDRPRVRVPRVGRSESVHGSEAKTPSPQAAPHTEAAASLALGQLSGTVVSPGRRGGANDRTNA